MGGFIVSKGPDLMERSSEPLMNVWSFLMNKKAITVAEWALRIVLTLFLASRSQTFIVLSIDPVIMNLLSLMSAKDKMWPLWAL